HFLPAEIPEQADSRLQYPDTSTSVAPHQDRRRPVPKTLLTVGEPAPWFTARCTSNPTFHFDTIAGRYVVLCFFGSAGQSASRQVLDGFLRYLSGFDDENVCFFGVSTDPEDERANRVQETLPGSRYFWDFDRRISQMYGAVAKGEGG